MPPESTPVQLSQKRSLMPWIIGGVVLVVLVIVAVAFFSGNKAPKTAHKTPSLPGPGAMTTGPRVPDISIPINSGASVQTRDFLKDPRTVADQINPGYYYLGYHTSTGPNDSTATADPPYIIEYIATTHYFNIGLYKEPIGEARKNAESYLTNALGISAQALCTLKYMVSVPERVNATYAGQNLGFSFCPGAVKLPS